MYDLDLYSDDYNYFKCDPDDDATAAGIKQAEDNAEAAGLDETVYLWIDDITGDLLTLCQKCRDKFFPELRYLDIAPLDTCFECEANDYN